MVVKCQDAWGTQACMMTCSLQKDFFMIGIRYEDQFLLGSTTDGKIVQSRGILNREVGGKDTHLGRQNKY